MSGKILTPPDIIEFEGHLVFLAGPIQGTYNWQSKAAEYLQKLNPALSIANPRRQYLNKEFDYNKQVDWETHHLRKASKEGLILFWLAKEETHDCSRAYAQTTRFELAEWKKEYERGATQIVLGIEEGFSGKRYMVRRFGQDCPDIRICSSLEETCEEAAGQIKKRFGEYIQSSGVLG